MYSPAARPSRQRAAPAKKRRLSAITGISSPLTASIGLPALSASRRAISSPCSSISVGEREQRLRALRRRRRRPAVERAPGGRDRAVDVLGARERGARDLLAGGRVEHRFGRRPRQARRLAVDEVAEGLCCARHRRCLLGVAGCLVAARASAGLDVRRARRQLQRLGDRRVGDLAGAHVHARAQARVALERLVDAALGELDHVRERRVGERVRRGDRHGAGHVRDAVVGDPVDLEGRVASGSSGARSRSSRPGRSRRRRAPPGASSAPAARA